MSPIEAMAKAIYAAHIPKHKWDKATDHTKSYFIKLACAAKDALAENVTERMTTTYLNTRVSNTATRNINALSIAAAIRAAGEE